MSKNDTRFLITIGCILVLISVTGGAFVKTGLLTESVGMGEGTSSESFAASATITPTDSILGNPEHEVASYVETAKRSGTIFTPFTSGIDIFALFSQDQLITGLTMSSNRISYIAVSNNMQ